ncbi:MAG: ABC transporter ATP-binding protein, partial [Undibacterium sp.]|nr:ABC transporter ATP-binding protein [Undibacterium sp.]
FISRLNREGHTIVLTTHYLEEAQALCNRVAMLKGGKVVALDSMSALIKRISGSQIKIQLAQGELPASLHHLIIANETQADKNLYALRFTNANEVQPILASLSAANCVLEDLQLQQADLEDVFLQIMGEAKQ